MRSWSWKILLVVIVGATLLFFFRSREKEVLKPDFQQTESASKAKPAKITHKTAEPGVREPQSVNKANSSFHTIEDLKREFGQGWSAIGETKLGRTDVKSILVTTSQEPRLNEKNVLHFVNQLRPMLGAAQAELNLKNGTTDHQYDVVQTIQGYEVYDGRVRIITDPKTSTPVIINNNLKPIEQFDSQVSVSAHSAEDLIQRKILGDIKPMTLEVQEKPVAFYVSGTKGELSWIVHAQWIENRQLKAKDFIVSAVEPRILFERNLIDH